MKEMEKIFSMGDRVYHKKFGLGTVVDINDKDLSSQSTLVKFDKESELLHNAFCYTSFENCEGKCWWAFKEELTPYTTKFNFFEGANRSGHNYSYYILGKRNWEIGEPFIFDEVNTIPRYIGYKNGVTTLVWYDGSKTKAKAKDNENIDYLYGFLIAYYKKIKGYKSERMRKHLQEVLYPYTFDFQVGYLMSVFRENCGLSVRKQEQFLDLYTLQPNLPFEKDESEISITFKVDEKFLK